MIWVVRAFLGLAGLAALLAFGGLFIPGVTRVEATAFVDRPAVSVYTIAADVRANAEWALWQVRSPVDAIDVSSPPTGENAWVSWRTLDGGKGRQTITLAEPHALVQSTLDFGHRGQARSVIAIDEQSDGVQVRLRYEANHGLDIIGRYASLLTRRQIRTAVEESLAALRSQAEALPDADFAQIDIRETMSEPMAIVFAERVVSGGAQDHETALSEAFAAVRQEMSRQDQLPAGPPMVITLEWSPPLWRFRAAIPYSGRPGEDGASVVYGAIDAGPVVSVTHQGPLRRGGEVYGQLQAYIAAHRLAPDGPAREILTPDGASASPDDQTTTIVAPVRALEGERIED